MKTLPPLIVLLGPTAVGKTELSLQLAELLNGEIVSADSRLFYKGMDIGTAKPSQEELNRVPHHLINVANPNETWSLALFQEAAQKAIQDIHHRNKIPLLVGGTGQYIEAVTYGWTPPEVRPNPAIRTVLETLAEENGALWLHDRLNVLDPQAAEKIDARNLRRTVRALEVIFTTGKPFSAQRGKMQSPYHLIKIGLKRPRPELYERIDARINLMFSSGLLDEVKQLLQAGYTPDLPALSAIGYRECIQVLNEEITQEQAIEQMKRLTRIFVRRQANWFKEDDPQIRWFLAGETNALEIADFVKKQLG